MIPEHILKTLDVVGIGYEELPDGGIVPVFPDEFYEAVAMTDPDLIAGIQTAVAGHCKAYTAELMNNAVAPIYGERWRSEIAMNADRRWMLKQLMQSVMLSANLGRYIRLTIN